MENFDRRVFSPSGKEGGGEEPELKSGKETVSYRGKLFEVVQEEVEIEEKTLTFEKVRRSPGVRLIMPDGGGKLLLTREFRRELDRYDYRLPGGKVFDSLAEFDEFRKTDGDISEKAKYAALKEAREETGFSPENAEYLSTSKLGATVEWDLHYFVAPVDRSKQGDQALEIGENIEVVWFDEKDLEELVLDPEQFSEERSVAALMRYLRRSKSEEMERGDGTRLRSLIETADLDSIRVRSENLEGLNEISNIIIVGSSLSGKTTLVDAVRAAMKTDDEMGRVLQIPKRVITRPQRANDNLVENQFVTTEEFDQLVQRGDIAMHWVRKMEGDREEKYGFLDIDKNKIPVLSGNNAVINNKKSVMPPDLLQRSLVVAIYCPDDIRSQRMDERSPDLVKEKPQEASYRLSDRAVNMFPEAHIVVKNFGRYQDHSKEDMTSLFKLISSLKS